MAFTHLKKLGQDQGQNKVLNLWLLRCCGMRLPVLGLPYHYFTLSSLVHEYMLSLFSHVRLFVTLWTVAHQAPLSMGFSRQEYWSGLPCPPPGDLSDPGIEPESPVAPALMVDSLPLSHQGSPSSLVVYL